jgi:hypothetical protein
MGTTKQKFGYIINEEVIYNTIGDWIEYKEFTTLNKAEKHFMKECKKVFSKYKKLDAIGCMFTIEGEYGDYKLTDYIIRIERP